MAAAAPTPGPDDPVEPATGGPDGATLADPAPSRTNQDMTHGLATKHRTAHARRQIRGPQLAPETLGARSGTTADAVGWGDAPQAVEGARGVVVRLQPGRRRRDGATRVGAVVPLDADHRASLTKPLAALGWDKTTGLVVEIDGHQAVVRVGKPSPQQPWLVSVRVAGGRMTLPPPVTGALDVAAGDQVLAIALPGTGELRLLAAADALQEITGDLAAEEASPHADETATASQTVPRTRVRPAFGRLG